MSDWLLVWPSWQVGAVLVRLELGAAQRVSLSPRTPAFATSAQTACQVSLTSETGLGRVSTFHERVALESPGQGQQTSMKVMVLGPWEDPPQGLLLPSEGSGLAASARQPE